MKSLTLPCSLLPEIDHVHHGLPGGGSVPGYIPLNQGIWFYSISKAMLSGTYLVEEETSAFGTATSGASSAFFSSDTVRLHGLHLLLLAEQRPQRGLGGLDGGAVLHRGLEALPLRGPSPYSSPARRDS